MQEAGSVPRSAPGRSCVACRRRKIKCNREQPCSYCVRSGIESCTYPEPKRDEPEREQITDDLTTRLRRIESILERLEVRSNQSDLATSFSANTSTSAFIRSNQMESLDKISTHRQTSGKLVNDQADGRYVTSGFWADLDEVEKKASNLVEQHQSSPSEIPSVIAHVGSPEYGSFIPGFGMEPFNIFQYHPSTDSVFALWRVYTQNVDPVVKLLHVPMTQQQLLWASQHLTEIPPAFESLMFSIYFAAVTSIRDPEKCEKVFHEDRQTLLRRYRLGFEQSLAKADFLSRPNITTIQSLTLFLVCARFSVEKGFVWTMVGLLIRLSMKLGLHRDPVDLGLSPFTSEMRRRLWWQIYVLDTRTAEDSDIDPFICTHFFNTKFPKNVNDADLDFEMTHNVSDAPYRTEMLFTLLRAELSYATRAIIFATDSGAGNGHTKPSMQERNILLENLVKKLEEKYLKHCDPQIPICALSEAATRMIITKVKLTLHHPNMYKFSEVCDETLHDLVMRSIEIIEGTRLLRTHEKYSRWVWLFEKYVDWDAVAFILHIMAANPLSVPQDRAWNAIDIFFQDWQDQVHDIARWRRLENLRAKVNAGRTPASQNDTSQTPIGANLGLHQAENNPNAHPLGAAVPNSDFSHEFPTHILGDQVDWNIDNFLLSQGMPTWDMELDVNTLRFHGLQ
ncbi:fungal-specific transcription factor domain-containing protein [Dendryphion nanum]|uniref:Fungal-specific transcription factor domain-containing protein n=1 Tax=Dendryphion nanum TaxID=256645 RepID=A0A9P9IPS7_9PLEO|nr:fungal-specific transcription factor domain-containing protein [Dendryphion nanum]